ncbi:MAG TPA: hypothetical protein TECP_01085 [Hyphomicrobiaceae bacterium MAG_BT-2024]
MILIQLYLVGIFNISVIVSAFIEKALPSVI